ncbi:thymidylate synthase [Psychrobacter celer]|uniref:thymidylate synthase n=1 Tax=Psychrobacter celer TaxID=306572 RepID=UPI003FCFA854
MKRDYSDITGEQGYLNLLDYILKHGEQAKEQLSRSLFKPPQVILNKDIDNIFDFGFDDIQLIDYQSHPAIKAPIAV